MQALHRCAVQPTTRPPRLGVPPQVVTALLRSLRAPFKESPDSTPLIGRLEASGTQVAEWLAADAPAVLGAVIPSAMPAGGAPPAADPAAQQREGGGEGGAMAAAAEADAAAAADAPGSAAPSPSAGPPPPPAVAAAAAAAAAAVAGLGRSGAAASGADGSQDAAGLEVELATEAR